MFFLSEFEVLAKPRTRSVRSCVRASDDVCMRDDVDSVAGRFVAIRPPACRARVPFPCVDVPYFAVAPRVASRCFPWLPVAPHCAFRCKSMPINASDPWSGWPRCFPQSCWPRCEPSLPVVSSLRPITYRVSRTFPLLPAAFPLLALRVLA